MFVHVCSKFCLHDKKDNYTRIVFKLMKNMDIVNISAEISNRSILPKRVEKGMLKLKKKKWIFKKKFEPRNVLI